MGAIEVVEDVARVDVERCIGCGLCTTACDTEAISMVPREYTPETPRTISEMGLTVATEKGRLEEFLKLMRR